MAFNLKNFLHNFFEQPSREAHKTKLLNEKVKLDADIFMNMCKTLYHEAPPNSAILVMDAKVSLDGENCEMECHVKKSQGKNARFAPSLEAQETLFCLLKELRNSMIEQKQPAWKGCKLTVDVPNDKYNADFKY